MDREANVAFNLDEVPAKMLAEAFTKQAMRYSRSQKNKQPMMDTPKDTPTMNRFKAGWREIQKKDANARKQCKKRQMQFNVWLRKNKSEPQEAPAMSPFVRKTRQS